MLTREMKQEVYDRVRDHLLVQGVPSYDALESACLYRGPDGTKCAVGVLISDEAFARMMASGKGANSSTVDEPHVMDAIQESLGWTDETMSSALPFLAELQFIHDDPVIRRPLMTREDRLERWKGRLRSLAVQEGLEP